MRRALLSKDFKKTLLLARKTEPSLRCSVLCELLRYVVENVPAQAKELFYIVINAAGEMGEHSDRWCYQAILIVAKVDRSLAEGRCTYLKLQRSKDKLKETIPSTFAHCHPLEVPNFIDQIDGYESKVKLLCIYAEELLKTDLSKAREILSEALTIINQQGAIDDGVLGMLASTFAPIDLDWALDAREKIKYNEGKDNCLLTITEKIAPSDPETALKFNGKFIRNYYKCMALAHVIRGFISKDPSKVPSLIETIKGGDSIEFWDPHLKDTMYAELAVSQAKKDHDSALRTLEHIEHPPRKKGALIKIALEIEFINSVEAKKIIAGVLDATREMEFKEKIESYIAIALLLQKDVTKIRVFPRYVTFAMKGFLKPKNRD